jgi:hypothetical protein
VLDSVCNLPGERCQLIKSGILALIIFFALALIAQLISYVRLRCFEGGHEKYVPSRWLFRPLAFAVPVVAVFHALYLDARSDISLEALAILLLASWWLGKYFYDRSFDRHAYFATGLEADPKDPYFDNVLTDLIMVSIATGAAIATLVTLMYWT